MDPMGIESADPLDQWLSFDRPLLPQDLALDLNLRT